MSRRRDKISRSNRAPPRRADPLPAQLNSRARNTSNRADPRNRAALAEAIDFIENFGNHHTLGDDLDWKSLRDEGRR